MRLWTSNKSNTKKSGETTPPKIIPNSQSSQEKYDPLNRNVTFRAPMTTASLGFISNGPGMLGIPRKSAAFADSDRPPVTVVTGDPSGGWWPYHIKIYKICMHKIGIDQILTSSESSDGFIDVYPNDIPNEHDLNQTIGAFGATTIQRSITAIYFPNKT